MFLKRLLTNLLIWSLLVFSSSAAITFTAGHRYTTNYWASTINQFNAAGTLVGTLNIPNYLGSNSTETADVRGLTFGPDGLLYVVVVDDGGFNVIAYNAQGRVYGFYPMQEVYVRGNSTYGKIAVDAQYIYVAGAGQVTRFEIGNPFSGTSIYTNNQVFDVEILPSGNLLVASAYEVNEITNAGTLVRRINPTGTTQRFVNVRGVEYHPATNKLFVTHLGYTGFYDRIMRLDATTGQLEEDVEHYYADDLFITSAGELLVGSSHDPAAIFTRDLDLTSTLGTSDQTFVTGYVAPTLPTPTAPALDTVPPVVTTPGNLSIKTFDRFQAKVEFAVSATDNVIVASLEVNPPSGSFFSVGTTPVQVKAFDTSGNVTTSSFNVTVSVAPRTSLSFNTGLRYTTAESSIHEYSQAGTLLRSMEIPTTEGLNGLASGPDGRVYVVAPRSTGFDVFTYERNGTLVTTYTKLDNYISGNISYGKIAVDQQYLYVAGGSTLVRFNLGVPNSGTVIHTGSQIFDVEALPSGNVLVGAANEIKELTSTGALVRKIAGTGTNLSVNDVRGIEYAADTGKLYISSLSSPSLRKVDYATGQVEKSTSFTYADDLDLTPSGELLVASRTEAPRVYSRELVQTGTLGVDEALFIMECRPLPDTTPPVIQVPNTIVTTSANSTGAIVNYVVQATDNIGVTSLTSNPPSGSRFPVGTTTVQVSASDAAGNTATASFQVQVMIDSTLPVIQVPNPIVVSSSDPSGAIVTYTVQATDNFAVTSLTSNPPSGSRFPIGTTRVQVSASDEAGNTATASFQVQVTPVNPAVVHSTLRTTRSLVSETVTDARIPSDATWSTLGVPSVDEHGNWAFSASWNSRSGSGSGVFVNNTLHLVKGASVPDVTGATFRSFRDPVIADGHLALVAAIGGGTVTSRSDTVIISITPNGTIELCAREGAEAPGAEGVTFQAFRSISLQPSRTEGNPPGLLFTAALTTGDGPTATTADRNMGAWLKQGPIYSLVYREGLTAVPGYAIGEAVKSADLLVSVSGSPGQGRGHVEAGTVSFNATSTMGRKHLLRFQDGQLTMLTEATRNLGGTTLPLAQWRAFRTLSQSSDALALSGELATNNGRPGAVPSAQTKGIFVGALNGNAWEPVARTGFPAPGLTGADFRSFGEPVLAASGGEVAFTSALKGPGVTSTNDVALWRGGFGQSPILVAREGSPAAGGGTWSKFTSIAAPSAEFGPLFVAGLKQGSDNVDASNDQGVWAVNWIGAVQRLFREGDQIGGKTIKTFVILKAVSTSPGVTHSFNEAGAVIWKATFTDGTSAILSTRLE